MKSMTSHLALMSALLTGCFTAGAAHAQTAPEPASVSPDDTVARTAANAKDDVVTITGQTITASQQAAEAIEFGNVVQVVTAEDILASGATNFAEAMQFLVKGVNIGYSPDEGEYTIRLDGGGDRDTLVILDGVPTYDRGPALEDIWGATTIDPHMIERVEVFRGGNSLFYGSNGGVGVVSIVTKAPDGTTKGEFGVNYGSFDTRELWGNYSFPLDANGDHSLMFYGSMQETDGPRIFNPALFVDNVARAGGIQHYPLNRNNIGAKYLWKIDDATRFRANAQYTEVVFQDPFPNTEIYSENTVRYPIMDALLERRWNDALLTEVQVYYSNPQLWNTELFPEICLVAAGCVDPNNPTRPLIPRGAWTGAVEPFANKGFGYSNQRTGAYKEQGATVRNTVNLGEWIEAVLGVQWVKYQDASDPSFAIQDQDNQTTGVFVDLRPKLPFSPDTAISLAVRTDFSDAFDSKTIWKFGVRQPLPAGLYVRANGGTSYSLPRTNELFTNIPVPQPVPSAGFGSVGNPDLAPEETETYNAGLGIENTFGDIGLSAEIGGFYTDITNRISTFSINNVINTLPIDPACGRNDCNFGATYSTWFNNSAITEIRGLTAEVNVNVGNQWRFNAAYTSQDASENAGSRKGMQLGETPAWFATGVIEWTSPDDRLTVQLLPRIQGSEYATGGPATPGTTRPANVGSRTPADTGVPRYRHNFGDYTVVNGTISYRAGDQMQHRFTLRVVNIFDEYYAERWGFGNQQFGSAFNRGEFTNTDDRFFFGYPFEGKPRSFFISYSTNF
ncbi:MAG: TonB-dependent receptor [Hyphomonadaceae bacterium]|nr:TonB-dependent receptor [Hyphomonadaceae bacterium]